MSTANDIFHWVGDDVAVSQTGDLQPVNDSIRTQQRILRRLLTNPGEYEFHPEYGAGLAQKIGNTAEVAKIKALIQGQILLEETVAKMPLPEITLQPLINGLACSIRYTDAITKQSDVLSFNVNT